jgi:ribonuclease HI
LNFCFDTGDIPDEWKIQKIVPVPKPGKDPNLGSSYRPIALLSCFLKILERLLKTRLEWFTENNNILSTYQFGFRKGRSSADNLSILTTEINIANMKREYTFAIFLDINAAYDNVPLNILHKKLINIGLPYKICRIINNILTDRTISVNIQASSPIVRKVWRGIMQGSVLSPLLFNIFCSDIEAAIGPECKILMYADDFVIYTSHRKYRHALKALETTLKTVEKWFFNNGLSLSPHKSQFVIFSRKHNLPNNIYLRIENISIPLSDKVKFLGVILDRKLTWREYIEFLIAKCERNLNPLRAVSRVWWGCHPVTMKLFYDALIRSQFDYASFIFHALPKYLENKIEITQNKGLRLILGAMRSTPVNSLQVECAEMPMHIRRQYLADRFMARRMILKDHPLKNTIKKMIDLFQHNHRMYNRPLPPLCLSYQYLLKYNDLIIPQSTLPGFGIDYDASYPGVELVGNVEVGKSDICNPTQIISMITEKWPTSLQIYTDGSKIPENTNYGCAFVIPELGIEKLFSISPPCTVFTAECIALKEALSFAFYSNFKEFIILSDSLSAIQSISGGSISKPSSYLLSTILKQLHNVRSQGKIVHIAWIPSHKGIAGNEMADEAAKRAIREGATPSDLCPDMGDIFLDIRDETFKTWRVTWNEISTHKGRHYRSIQDSIPSKPWFFSMRKFSKKHISIISRMRLGHCCIASHLHKIKVVDSPYCECGEEETLDHILLSCPISSPIDVSNIKDVQYPLSASYILSLKDVQTYKALTRYIDINNTNI